MRQQMLIFLVCLVILTGCATPQVSQKVEEAKAGLKQCYESKCDLVIKNDDFELELDYPFDFCFYESREECVNEFSSFITLEFCDNFTYKQLCYEDLAVLTRDKEICLPDMSELFEQYKEEFPEMTEEQFQEEFSEDLDEYMDYLPCSQYYDAALRTIESGNSHCEDVHRSDVRCYAELISGFKNVDECEKYRDMLKVERFGIEEFQDFTTNNCYWWYAATHDDISICENLETSGERDHCFQRYANAKRDATYCEQIEHPTVKEVCQRVGDQGVRPGCVYYSGAGEMCFDEW